MAIKRINISGEKLKTKNLDIGFKVFRVADTNIKWNSLMDAGQLDLAQIESTPDLVDFMPDANDVDIVYELMLRQRSSECLVFQCYVIFKCRISKNKLNW